jgi:hypothetical protein
MDMADMAKGHVLIVVCCLTRYVAYIELKDKKADTVLDALKRRWFAYFGYPGYLMHDRAAEFMSDLLRGALRALGILTIPTHSKASNGAAEVQVGILKHMLILALENVGDFCGYHGGAARAAAGAQLVARSLRHLAGALRVGHLAGHGQRAQRRGRGLVGSAPLYDAGGRVAEKGA